MSLLTIDEFAVGCLTGMNAWCRCLRQRFCRERQLVLVLGCLDESRISQLVLVFGVWVLGGRRRVRVDVERKTVMRNVKDSVRLWLRRRRRLPSRRWDGPRMHHTLSTHKPGTARPFFSFHQTRPNTLSPRTTSSTTYFSLLILFLSKMRWIYWVDMILNDNYKRRFLLTAQRNLDIAITAFPCQKEQEYPFIPVYNI